MKNIFSSFFLENRYQALKQVFLKKNQVIKNFITTTQNSKI